MASTLKINTLTGVSTAGSISVTGEGNSTTTNLQQGLSKVWSNTSADGTTLNDSLNVSSLGDSATGQQNINFTNAMGNTNFSTTICPQSNIDQEWEQIGSRTTSLANIRAYNGSNYADIGLMIQVAGDLA
jgi:hypothetical protein